jgi:hypothetical protein
VLGVLVDLVATNFSPFAFFFDQLRPSCLDRSRIFVMSSQNSRLQIQGTSALFTKFKIIPNAHVNPDFVDFSSMSPFQVMNADTNITMLLDAIHPGDSLCIFGDSGQYLFHVPSRTYFPVTSFSFFVRVGENFIYYFQLLHSSTYFVTEGCASASFGSA